MTFVYARIEQVTDIHRRGCVEVNKLAFITVTSSTLDTETYWPFSTSTGTGLHAHENSTLSPRTSFVISVVSRGDEISFALIVHSRLLETTNTNLFPIAHPYLEIFELVINPHI
jgi:hypothetical protein